MCHVHARKHLQLTLLIATSWAKAVNMGYEFSKSSFLKVYTVEPLYNVHFGTSHFWVIFAVI